MSAAKDNSKPDGTTDEPQVEVSKDDLVSSDYSYTEHNERRWLQLVIYVLVALAFAVLVVFAGRWVYHEVTHKKTTTLRPAGNNTPKPPTNASSQSANNSSGSSSNPSSNASAAAQSTPAELTNTGPGNVLALFIGTAVIIGGLHFILDLRRGQ